MKEVTAKLKGPMADLLTPCSDDGMLDYRAWEENLDFVIRSGIQGVVVAGAAGEYFSLSVDHRDRIVEDAVARTSHQYTVLANVGGGNIDDCVALGQRALRAGADCLLLPAPHFYHYDQDDLDAFYRAAASRIDGPILIYNLPALCTPVEKQTALRLIESVGNIIGINQCCGNLEILQELRSALGAGAVGILGQDQSLAEGLRDHRIGSVISGLAGVVPELTVALFEAHQSRDGEAFEQAAALLRQFIDKIEPFPYPWALKWLAEWRGLSAAKLPFPLSRRRTLEKGALQEWFAGKLPQLRALTESKVA